MAYIFSGAHRWRIWGAAACLVAALGLSGCADPVQDAGQKPDTPGPAVSDEARESTFFDLFDNRDDPNVTFAVNRYLWIAALEVLDFMPVKTADPFSGVIGFGYGTPPGGQRAYAATVLVNDPALDARSLVVTLRTRNGPVSADLQRQIEDAILTRARQLRIEDSRL